jgi:hypothetical protein
MTMLDARQAFRFGFLLKCAHAGVGPDRAEAVAEGLLKEGGLKEMASALGTWATMGTQGVLAVGGAGLGLAAAGGAGLGLAAAHASEPSIDPAEVKRRELTDAYSSFADQLESQHRAARPAAPSRSRIHQRT